MKYIFKGPGVYKLDSKTVIKAGKEFDGHKSTNLEFLKKAKLVEEVKSSSKSKPKDSFSNK